MPTTTWFGTMQDAWKLTVNGQQVVEDADLIVHPAGDLVATVERPTDAGNVR